MQTELVIMKHNTPAIWDTYWKDETPIEQDVYAYKIEKHSVRWSRISKLLSKEFGKLEGLKSVELGSGMGTYSALLAESGAQPTLIDYSEGALVRARQFFDHQHLSAEYVQSDLFDLPKKYINAYDVSFSMGLTEHFLGEKRILVNKVHLDVLKPGGLAIIVVPNALNLPYRIFKYIFEKTGRWEFGEEYPYTRRELRNVASQLGINDSFFFGESIFQSLRFINPFEMSRKLRKWLGIKTNYDPSTIKHEIGTPFDEYIAYAIALCLKKPR